MRELQKWRHIVLSFLGITAGAFLVEAWFDPSFRWSKFAGPLGASFVYTVCIGTLAWSAAARVWPAVANRPFGVRWLLYLGSIGAAVAAGTLVALTILNATGWVSVRNFWTAYLFSLKFAAFIAGTFGLALMIYEYWRHKYQLSELERERAMKLATEAQLASLEARIHPHFLFNTLNSISALIHQDPDAADAQLQRLSALLRFSLDAGDARLVPLHHELKILRDYLEIERTRFGDRLRYRIHAPDELNGVLVPPLSIQTLVENSVKHVIAPSRAGGEIVVELRPEGRRLRIEVADGGPGVNESALLAGHGLDNLRSRLLVLFDGRAALSFSPSTVRMELPI